MMISIWASGWYLLQNTKYVSLQSAYNRNSVAERILSIDRAHDLCSGVDPGERYSLPDSISHGGALFSVPCLISASVSLICIHGLDI